MNIDNLVDMANRIGDFFQSMPDKNEAKRDIAMHLKKFWEPRMRNALIENIDLAATDRLHGIVREAVKENLEMLAANR
jgi:formate dehydrogenase subunit delta